MHLAVEMDVGEGQFFEPLDVSGTNISDIPSNGSIDSLFDEIFKDTLACTHAHTCKLAGPHSSHTHTCYHVHTKLVPSMGAGDDDMAPTDDTAESTEKNGKKRSLGNREAVRKYRQKQKAQAASLEDEVVRLKTLNQRLMKKIQSHVMLEAEVARLKCLLVDVRGRIEGEIGSFPYPIQQAASQNVLNLDLRNGCLMNPCNMLCGDQSYCLHPSADRWRDPQRWSMQQYSIQPLMAVNLEICSVWGTKIDCIIDIAKHSQRNKSRIRS